PLRVMVEVSAMADSAGELADAEVGGPLIPITALLVAEVEPAGVAVGVRAVGVRAGRVAGAGAELLHEAGNARVLALRHEGTRPPEREGAGAGSALAADDDPVGTPAGRTPLEVRVEEVLVEVHRPQQRFTREE